MLEPRQLKEQHYCQLSSLSMEMGRTAKDFGGHLNSSNIPTISEGTDSGCNLYSVRTGWMLLPCLFSFGERL